MNTMGEGSSMTTTSEMNGYQFQLLQYMPNLVSGEHVNIGVLLYNKEGRLLEARFARDFQRLRGHPLADMDGGSAERI